MSNIKTHLSDMQKQLDEIFQKKTIGSKICDKCNNEFELYQFIAGGKLHSNKDNVICPECRIKEEDEKHVREIIMISEQKKFAKYNKLSVAPFELENEALSTYIPKNDSQIEALRITKKFLHNELNETTLFLQGGTGLGKTHLSYSVYKAIKLENKQTAIFIDLPSLLSKIRGTYNNRVDFTQEQIMEMISDCYLLILDDVGAEYVKPDANGYESWAADILFQIVNSRQGKMNIYTTNFTSEYLSQKYGLMSARIVSRLMNKAKVIKLEGRDHRLMGY